MDHSRIHRKNRQIKNNEKQDLQKPKKQTTNTMDATVKPTTTFLYPQGVKLHPGGRENA